MTIFVINCLVCLSGSEVFIKQVPLYGTEDALVIQGMKVRKYVHAPAQMVVSLVDLTVPSSAVRSAGKTVACSVAD